VHPYDDDKIIAGAGTIGLEFLEDFPDLDTLVVPVGGGGLIAGIAVAAKALKPSIRIIGVETKLFPSMSNTLKKQSAQVWSAAWCPPTNSWKKPWALLW
jgi:threonine dehydratase